jgi:phosphoribosylformylglycinamidine synthase
LVPLPIAHGEGRFETADPAVRERIEREGLALLRYVDAEGKPAARYPDDPNGAMLQAAGITNARGNVLALMPHPERASWLFQVPLDWRGAWGDRRRAAVGSLNALDGEGPGRFLFESLARHLGVPRSTREAA